MTAKHINIYKLNTVSGIREVNKSHELMQTGGGGGGRESRKTENQK